MVTHSFATFLLNGQLFGIDILLIREINRQLDISSVPHSPQYIQGLVNLRGQIVTVLDLKRRLGMAYSAVTERSHNVILKTDMEVISTQERFEDFLPLSDKVGLLVDEIADVIAVTEDKIEPSPANLVSVDSRYLLGAIKTEKQLISILSVKNVLSE
jgi:purine-binding chemotaxis protein CheW